ncbi:MAG: hypothetical protein WCW17_04070, partial [Patescibacteria group bacterium]
VPVVPINPAINPPVNPENPAEPGRGAAPAEESLAGKGAPEFFPAGSEISLILLAILLLLVAINYQKQNRIGRLSGRYSIINK